MMRRHAASLLSALLMTITATAAAHEGHDHGDAAAVVPAMHAEAPRLALSSAKVELLAVRESEALVITVDDYATNAPLEGLTVKLRLGSTLIEAKAAGDGTYTVADDLLDAAGEGPLPVTFLLHGAALDEQLEGSLPTPAEDHDAESAHTGKSYWPWPVLAMVASVALIVGLLRRRRAAIV